MSYRLLILLLPIFLLSQSPGTISGRVVDKVSNEGLVGVNVMVKGTYYGGATDIDGQFFISGISAGTYDIEASIIGYKVLLQTGIKISSGSTTVLNFEMEETVLTLGEEVVVLGSKPLFDVDETASVARVTSEDIANKVVSSVEDILSVTVLV